jgi:DNA-binding HxlR family transcriptional regulator
VAKSLDVLGDRWTLLIVRDLMRGTARFTDLAGSLHGIPRNLLTDRLRTLEASGLVDRREFRELPPRVEYSLTAKGRSLQPILEAIGRWGWEHLLGDPDPSQIDLDCMLARLPHVYRGGAESGLIRLTIHGFPGARYLALTPDHCELLPDAPSAPTVRLTTDLRTWLGLLSGHVDPDKALLSGALRADGDRQLLRRLPYLFDCPVGI